MYLFSSAFIEKVKAGKAKVAGSGFGGKGLERLEQDRDAKERAQRSAYGEDDKENKEKADKEEGEGGKKEGEEGASGEGDGKSNAEKSAEKLGIPDIEVEVRKGPAPDTGRKGFGIKMNEANMAALRAAEEEAKKRGIAISGLAGAQSVIAKLTASIQAKKQQQFGKPAENGGGDDIEAARRRDPDATDYHAIVPISPVFSQKARWRVTNKDTMARLIEESGASVTNKGVHYPKGKEPGPDDPPPLHLLVESNSADAVRHAVRMIKEILYEAEVQSMEAEISKPGGRYTV